MSIEGSSSLTTPKLEPKRSVHLTLMRDVESHSSTNCEERQDDDDDHHHPQQHRKSAFDGTDFCRETKVFLELASVTSLMFVGFSLTPMITASYIGRLFGPVYLTAFSLANLMGNLCTQTLVTGLFGAIDTLSPQAMGKGDFAEVGCLTVRGVVASFLLLIPVNALLVVYLEDILVRFGEDPVAAYHAHQWYNIFVISLPFSILYASLCKFLTVQHILQPVIVVSVLATVSIAPTLQVFASRMGFLGTAVASVVFWMVQSLGLLAYVCLRKPHDQRTWDSRNVRKDLLDTSKWMEFWTLGIGGVVAQCEWVFWEALGLVVGKLGVIPMTVHTIPTQIVMNVSTLPYAFGIALAVRMGISMPSSVRRTQWIAATATTLSFLFFGIVSVLLWIYRDSLIAIFVASNDQDADVLDLARSIWPQVSFFNANIALFNVLAGVSSGLGKQWALGLINIFFLWIVGMPMIYYKTIWSDDGGLKDAWFWMNLSYIGINGSLIGIFLGSDWYEIQKHIITSGSCCGCSDACTDGDALAKEHRSGLEDEPCERTALLQG